MGSKGYIVWFIGAAAWLLDAALLLHRGPGTRALLPLAIAILFFAAGMFFQRAQPRH